MGTRIISFPTVPPLLIWMLVLMPPLLCADCPYYCDCKWKNGKEAIICSNVNITSIPNRLDTGTQVLDLSRTLIDSIRNDTFASLGLVNLQKLYVTTSRISRIERYAFRKLVNLVELDLSNNVLESIPSHSFKEIIELRELKLKNNLIRRIANHAFISVANLIRLDLSDCRITFIEPNAFVNLEATLEWLRIDGNQLQVIRYTAIKSLESLHGLELARNPWNCSCSLKGLYEWILESNIPFGDPPTCHTPQRLKGKSWNNLKKDDFGCVPVAKVHEMIVEGVEGNNVTITCDIIGTPTPTTRWLYRNNVTRREIVASARIQSRFGINSTVNLIITKVDFHDAGTYSCIAENSVGQAEASTRLIVTKQPTATMKTATMIGIIALALILVFVTWLMAIYLLLSKEKKKLSIWKMKRNKALYHKIEMDKNGGNVGGGGGGVVGGQTLEQHGGFTTEDEDKYDALTVTNRKYRVEDDAYEMSAKLLTNFKQRDDAKTESGFRSPKIYRGNHIKMEPPPDLFREQSSDLMHQMQTESDYENLPLRTRLNVRATMATTSSTGGSGGGYYEAYDRNCNDLMVDESRFCTLPMRLGGHMPEQRRKLSADFSSNYSLSSVLNANTRSGSIASINNNSGSASNNNNNNNVRQSNASLPTSPISAIKTSISSITPLLNFPRQLQHHHVMPTPATKAPPSTNLTYASTSAAMTKMHHMEMQNNYLQNGCSSLLRNQVSGSVGGGGGASGNNAYLEAATTFENYTDIPMHEYASLKNNNNSSSSSNNGNNGGSNFNSMRLNRNLLLKRLGNNSNKFY